MKKIGILFTVIIMAVLFVVSASAATEGYYTYEVENGEATIVDIDDYLSGDRTDWAHYGAASMNVLGELFASSNHFMMITAPVAPPVTECTVTFDANGGSCDTTSVTVNAGGIVILPTPTYIGYTFTGWSDGTNTYTADAGYTVTGDVTLTAQWEAIKYTVTYDANGGSVASTSETVNAGETVTLPTPTRTGYRFLGWYTAASNGSKVGDAGANYAPTGDITLYAQWEQKMYTITVTNNAGNTVTVGGIKNGDQAVADSEITFTLTYKKSWFLGSNTKQVTVTIGETSERIDLTDGVTVTRTFEMPEKDITISIK
jgi:uncharacterized repeat protein (TIGR02543 family)